MKKVTLTCGAALVALAIAGPAYAQNSDEAQAQAGAAADDGAIIVTARRREESAQTVPVSITALTSAALEEKTVRSLSDLTAIAPGIRFVQTGGSSNMNVVMRGLQRVPIGDSPNAVINYFAGVPVNFNGSNLPTYDLENIQVYKGPQGTLFGRNAIGGAVVITPKKPTFELGGYVQAGYGNFDNKTIEAAVNVPLINDVLAVRLSGRIARRDGTVKNLGNGRDFGDVHQDLFRVSVLFQPSDNITNTFVYDYFKGREAGSPGIITDVLAGGLPRIPPLAGLFNCSAAATPCNPIDPNRDIDALFARQQAIGPFKIYADTPIIGGVATPYAADRDIWGISNTTDFQVGENVIVRNIFGWRSTNGFSPTLTSGFTFSPLPLFQPSLQFSNKQISNELQVLGTAFDGKLDFVFGGMFIDESTPKGNGTRFIVLAPNAPWTESYNDKTNRALYGQVGITLAQGLKLNAGGRYNKDTSHVCTGSSGALTARPNLNPEKCRALLPSQKSELAYSGDAFTYTLGVDWQATDNVFLYLTHRKGYREGGVNTPGFTSPCATGATGAAATAAGCVGAPATSVDFRPYQTYGPETLTDFEAGVKTQWTVGNMTGRFNISAFTGKYGNVLTPFSTTGLLPTNDPSTPTATSIAINTGSRRLSGFESELVIKPLQQLTLTNLSAYTHQKLLSAPIPPIPGLQPPALDPASPSFSTTTSLRFAQELGSSGTELVFNASHYWQGSFFVGNAKLPSYGLANMRLDLNNLMGSNVDVGFFMNNVTNKQYIVAAGASSTILGFFSNFYGDPRTFGAEVKFRF